MSRPTHRRLVAAFGAVALTAVIGAAGCSGDGRDRASPTTGATTTTTPPTTTTTRPTASLPASFPATIVPLPEGARLIDASEISASQSLVRGWLLTYDSARPAAEAIGAYITRLTAAGYRTFKGRSGTGTRSKRGQSSVLATAVIATSADWTITAIGGDGGGSTILALSVSPHKVVGGIGAEPRSGG